MVPSLYQPARSRWRWPWQRGRGVADSPSRCAWSANLTRHPRPTALRSRSRCQFLLDECRPLPGSAREGAGSLGASIRQPDLLARASPCLLVSLALVHAFAERGCSALTCGLSAAHAQAAASSSAPPPRCRQEAIQAGVLSMHVALITD